jgi:hypothetical protein
VSETDRVFHAYEMHEQTDMPIVTAPAARDWMDASHERYAYRCLPLTIANQSGWLVPSPVTFSACWDGGTGLDAVTLTFAAPRPDGRVTSHFGHGILTFAIPYLFRTPPGVNLWVKGPANYFKDGVQPLEGVVETDWLPSTFTMNWKLTRPGHPVRFEKGEPVCMLVPVPRGLAEGLEPRRASLANNAEVMAQYLQWQQERSEFLAALRERDPEALARGWQRDYMKGLLPTGARAPAHQTRLRLKEFARAEDAPPTPEEKAFPTGQDGQVDSAVS